MLQTVGEGAERLLCTPHAQPWPTAWTHGREVAGHTLGRRRETLPNKGRFSELFGASYLTPAFEKVIFFLASSFQTPGVSCGGLTTHPPRRQG